MPVVRQQDENKVAHALATHSRMATFEWRHKIKIKNLFADETTHDVIDALCRCAVSQIEAVIASEKLRRDQKSDNERDYFIKYLNEAKDGFDCLIGAVKGESVNDRQDQFNYILSELYDIGDWKIELRDGTLQKFCWID